MKIALFVPSQPSGGGANGIITYASQIVPALRQLGHEVYILTPQMYGSIEDRYAVNLSQFNPGTSRQLWSKFRGHGPNDLIEYRLKAALQKLKCSVGIDVLEIEESFGWSAALSAADIVPVVVRLHGPWFLTGAFDSQAGLDERVRREGLGISSASVVTSPSMAGLDAVRRRYGLALGNATVIPNPVEPASSGAEWKLESCDRDRILFVGRFDLLKGADLVLRAFQRLSARYPTLRLTFAGPDKGVSEGDERLSIEQFIQRHMPEAQSRIDYLGLVRANDLLRLRQQHLFTIVASRFEMFSYAVAEAMALGCPIVASSAGAIPELISDRATGLLFESGDIASLVEQCETLLTDHALLIRLGRAAKQFSESQLAPLLLAKKTESVYKMALSSDLTNSQHL